MALYATTDMMTTVIGFVSAVRKALRAECGIGLAEYRLLAFLCDRGKPAGPAETVQVVGASPAMATLTANALVEKGLARRIEAAGGKAIVATGRGVGLCRDADLVLEHIHHSLLSPLSEEQRETIVVGTQMTVMATTKANRMKGDSFYGEFETLRAFLIIERVMTETPQSLGLSINGFRILFLLDELGGGATPGYLAERLALAPSAITYAAKALERDGFVERAPERLDRRSVRVSMTELGSCVLREAQEQLDPLLVSGIRAATLSERRFIQEACELMASAVCKQARLG